jgi:phosphoserine phosphatase
MSIKLIAFDLDGVLVEDPGSWAMVHKGLGTTLQAKKHEEEFHKGLIDYDEWIRKDALLWNGAEIHAIEQILWNIPLMKGIHETMPKLKQKYRLVVISGGLKILADRIKDLFDFEYVTANEFIVQGGRVRGMKNSVSFNDKGKLLRNVAMKFNMKASECAAVGDYLNDIPMFNTAGLSVAFNPKSSMVAKKANYVIYKKDLTQLLEIF